MGIACTFCRKRKRKCDGKDPCSFCIKYNKTGKCEYLVDQDKRKFKYDSTFVDYLELKVDLLQQLAGELIRNDVQRAKKINESLVREVMSKHDADASHFSSISTIRDADYEHDDGDGDAEDEYGSSGNNATGVATIDKLEGLLKDLANEDAIDELISTKWKVRQDLKGHTQFYGPVSGRQQAVEDDEDQEDDERKRIERELSLDPGEFESEDTAGSDIVALRELIRLISTNQEFRSELLKLFQDNFTSLFHILKKDMVGLQTWEYPNQDITKQLLMSSVFLYALNFTDFDRSISSLFLKQILSIVIKASSYPINEHFLHATLILSSYQMGHGKDASAWAMNAITSSMCLYLKLDRIETYKKDVTSNGLFWGIVLEDRIITNVVGRASRVPFFRVTTPYYQTKLQPNDPDYLNELVFEKQSKLWFIFDKYLSQIYSFKAEHLHKSHKLMLIKQSLESLQSFQDELPAQLKLTTQRIQEFGLNNYQRPYSNDGNTTSAHENVNVLILNLSYSVIILLLHRAYLKQIPLKVIQITIQQCEISSSIISRLIQLTYFPSPNPNDPNFNNTKPAPRNEIPHFISYLILTCATFDLFLLTYKDEAIKQNSFNRIQIYVDALLKFGKTWSRCLKDLKVLSELAKNWKLRVPSLENYRNSISEYSETHNNEAIPKGGIGLFPGMAPPTGPIPRNSTATIEQEEEEEINKALFLDDDTFSGANEPNADFSFPDVLRRGNSDFDVLSLFNNNGPAAASGISNETNVNNLNARVDNQELLTPDEILNTLDSVGGDGLFRGFNV